MSMTQHVLFITRRGRTGLDILNTNENKQNKQKLKE